MNMIRIRRISVGSYVKLTAMASTPLGILLGMVMALTEVAAPEAAYFSVFEWEFEGVTAILLALFLFPVWWVLVVGVAAGLLTYPIMWLWWRVGGGMSLMCEGATEAQPDK